MLVITIKMEMAVVLATSIFLPLAILFWWVDGGFDWLFEYMGMK